MNRLINGIEVELTADEQAAVETEWAANELEKNKNMWFYKRKEEYGSLEDQLEYIYDNGLDGWKQKIQAIKEKYPKPVN